MFILPINQVVLKRLMGEGNTPCNIYEPLKLDEKRVIIQDFIKFIETCINRIRRPNNSIPKGPRVCDYYYYFGIIIKKITYPNNLFRLVYCLIIIFIFAGSKWRKYWEYKFWYRYIPRTC